MSNTPAFFCPEQIEQLQELGNLVASKGTGYLIIEISNNHPRRFWPLFSIKAALPPEELERQERFRQQNRKSQS